MNSKEYSNIPTVLNSPCNQNGPRCGEMNEFRLSLFVGVPCRLRDDPVSMLQNEYTVSMGYKVRCHDGDVPLHLQPKVLNCPLSSLIEQ